MDFRLTQEQDMLVEAVRSFVEKELLPHEDDVDRADAVSPELAAQIRGKALAAGFYAFNMPEEVGGGGLDYLSQALVERELSKVSWALHVFVARPSKILMACTGEQLGDYLLPCVQGEKTDCFALTEPGAGSDVGALATTYKRENGKIYLNGTKTFITSSAGVKYLVIMAKNADDPTMFTEFFLDMSKPGVKLSPLTKLGLRMDSCCEVYMDNVELEEKDIFGKEGNGFMRGVSDFNFERWLVGACDYGTAICAFEDAMAHANSRIAFGKPISRFQLNQIKITDMCIKLTNMKNMLYEAAWNADNNDGNFDPAAAAMCKYYCANASFEVTDDAMQIMGGIAVASEHRINRIWRDLRVDRVSGGTDEMMRPPADRPTRNMNMVM